MFEKDIRAVVVKEEEIYHETLYDILFITDLIHHTKRIPTIRINRLIKTHRTLDRIHRIGDLLFRDPHLIRNLHDRRFPQILLREKLPR